MLTNASTLTIRGRRIGVLITVAAILFVPAIVRATSTLRSVAPLRLNRGFETPPSKTVAVTSIEQISEPASTATFEPTLVGRRAAPPDPRASSTPSEHSPDPQRGPPT